MKSKVFGDFIKEQRLKKGMSLRAFCRLIGYDASNWSKIERGVQPPPQEEEKLSKIAQSLDISEGSDEWHLLLDKANIDAGIIPPDILSDEQVFKALPVFFRTLRNERPSVEELEKLIERIRRGV